MDHLCFCVCVSHAIASVHCCHVVTCWEMADLLALVGDVYCCHVVTCWEMADLLALVGDVYCIFVTFPCGILGQVWYLIVSFPDHCRLSYFV